MPFKIKIFTADTLVELEEKTNLFLEQCPFVPIIAPARYGQRKWYASVTYTHLEGNERDTLTDEEKETYQRNNVSYLYKITQNMTEVASALGLEVGEVNRYLMKAKASRGNGEE
ncbi:hypothetical protein HZC30_04200 [Candidatus Woesearchaeota archaeon]|nr:hypothetical protein [Candidatus Woesearchaeota archaeon]